MWINSSCLRAFQSLWHFLWKMILELVNAGVLSPFFRLQCECRHNTCGASCDRCCPGFNQKPWRAATVDNPNECQRKYTCTILHLVCNLNYSLILPMLLASWITPPREDWSILLPLIFKPHCGCPDMVLWWASVKSWQDIPDMVCVMNSMKHNLLQDYCVSSVWVAGKWVGQSRANLDSESLSASHWVHQQSFCQLGSNCSGLLTTFAFVNITLQQPQKLK